jgi:hypothetical protein
MPETACDVTGTGQLTVVFPQRPLVLQSATTAPTRMAVRAATLVIHAVGQDAATVTCLRQAKGYTAWATPPPEESGDSSRILLSQSVPRKPTIVPLLTAVTPPNVLTVRSTTHALSLARQDTFLPIPLVANPTVQPTEDGTRHPRACVIPTSAPGLLHQLLPTHTGAVKPPRLGMSAATDVTRVIPTTGHTVPPARPGPPPLLVPRFPAGALGTALTTWCMAPTLAIRASMHRKSETPVPLLAGPVTNPLLPFTRVNRIVIGMDLTMPSLDVPGSKIGAPQRPVLGAVRVS